MPSPTRTTAHEACRLIRLAKRLRRVAARLQSDGFTYEAAKISRAAGDLDSVGTSINDRESLMAQTMILQRASKAVHAIPDAAYVPLALVAAVVALAAQVLPRIWIG